MFSLGKLYFDIKLGGTIKAERNGLCGVRVCVCAHECVAVYQP